MLSMGVLRMRGEAELAGMLMKLLCAMGSPKRRPGPANQDGHESGDLARYGACAVSAQQLDVEATP